MSTLIGQSIGHYHILEQLGEGGMATVYKAYDTRFEREVAVKVIRRDAFPAEHHTQIFKRFEREARALAKLSHPNIVSVIEYGEHEGSPFLVMEYVAGGTMKQKLGKPIPWKEALQLLLPIAGALDYAHKNKIVHRDVKPSNILITKSGEPKLTDFGIAKVLETDDGATIATTTGVGIGTPEYMAPEQGLGQDVDIRADIYSLGIVLYELITGRKPFRADTPMAVIVKHINEPLPRLRQFVRDVPDAVEKTLVKALAKRPEDRYRNMADLGKALYILLDGVRAKDRETSEKTAAKARRREAAKTTVTNGVQKKRLFQLAGMMLVLLAAGGVIWSGNRWQNIVPLNMLSTDTSTPTSISFTPTFIPTATPTRTSTAVPTATPTPIYISGNSLLYEDFEDGTYQGWAFGGGESYWEISNDNGNRVLIGAPPDLNFISMSYRNNRWKDYALDIKIKFSEMDSAENGMEIYFRTNSNDDCHSYDFGLGSWWFLGRSNGCNNFMHLADAESRQIALDKWYDVRIEAFRSDIRVYVDRSLIHYVSDSSYVNGGIGFEISSGNIIYLDDIKVIELVER